MTPPLPAVRRLAPGEEAAVVALWQRCGLTRPWNDPDADLRRALDGPSSAVLVACSDAGDVVGSVMVGVDGHRAWVYYLGVDPDRREAGLGRVLMAAAEEWAAERGAPKLLLMVRSSNTAVRGFYEALDYAEQDTIVLGRRLDGVPDGGARR
ncbi:MAG: GNAT family acetyltransferase [Kineosporiaceae bacterium]